MEEKTPSEIAAEIRLAEAERLLLPKGKVIPIAVHPAWSWEDSSDQGS